MRNQCRNPIQKPLNLLIKRFSSNSSMKKKPNFTLKNMVTSMCERNTPFGKNFFLHFRTPKRILKICPLVFLYIPIWKSYYPVLLDFFRGMKDISKIKHNYQNNLSMLPMLLAAISWLIIKLVPREQGTGGLRLT